MYSYAIKYLKIQVKLYMTLDKMIILDSVNEKRKITKGIHNDLLASCVFHTSILEEKKFVSRLFH